MPRPRTLDEQARLVCAGDPRPLLDALAQETRVSRRRFLLHVLERLLAWADPGTLDDATREAAIAAGLGRDAVAAPPAAPTHAVLVPFVAPGSHAFVRTLFVTYRPYGGEDELELSATSRAAVSRAIAAAAARLGRSMGGGADGHVLAAAQPDVFRGLRVEGASLAAAAFVSATSLWTRRAVRAGTAITGALAAGGAVASVGEVASKLTAARSAPRVRRLVMPAHDRDALGTTRRAGEPAALEVLGVRNVDELLRETLEASARPAPSLDSRVRAADRAFRGGWQRWQWPGLRAELEPLLAEALAQSPAQRPDLVVELGAMLAAVLRHVGETDASLSLVARAEAVRDADSEGVPDAPLAKLARQKAMSLRQRGDFREATLAARESIAAAKHGRLRGELIPSHGTAGLVALSRGDVRAATRHHHAALELARRHTPASAPRAASYLVEALGHAGRLDDAARVFDEAQQDIAAHTSSAARGPREAWLRTSFAGALLRAGDAEGARSTLDHLAVREAIATEPFPGLQARRWLGLALCRAGRVEDGLTWLAHSPSAYGRLLAGHALALAHQNVLHEARSRLGLEVLDDDARARALDALHFVPTARWLRPYADRCAEVLRGRARGRAFRAELAETLDALLDACERLG